MIIVVYVDDILEPSKTKRDEEDFISGVRSRLEIKDLSEATHYLGCNISRDRGTT